MGDMPPPAAILHEDLPASLRYIPRHREQLLRLLPLHPGSHNSKIQQEIQEDGFRGDDDLPAEHADQRVVRGRPRHRHRRGLRIPELLPQVILTLSSPTHSS